MKRYFLLITFILLIFLVACSKNLEADSIVKNSEKEVTKKERSIEEISNDFNIDFQNKSIENLINNYIYSDEMNLFMTTENLENLFVQMNLGKTIEKSVSTSEIVDDFIVVSTPRKFENKQLTINIVFDQDKVITGFNFGEYPKGDNITAQNEKKIKEITVSHHLAFSKEDYESLISDYSYTNDMLDVISKEMYKQTKDTLSTGELIEIKQPFIYEVQGYLLVSLPVVYESKSFNYNLVFDDQNLIAGSNIGDYKEDTTFQLPIGIKEILLVAEVNDMALDGILTTPVDGSNFPCVILVHGSGPSDKDETILGNKPFRDIAWGLAKQGIASYRYDKASYAFPEKFKSNFEMTLYDETINDAVDIYNMIKKLEGINSEEVYILGHSLGGNVIPLIAEEINAKGYIIMAGNTRPLNELIIEQVNYLVNVDDVVTEDEQAYVTLTEAEIMKLEDLNSLDKDTLVMGAFPAYWEFILSYDPVKHAKAINEKVLVLQGMRDYQVTMDDYNLWLEAFSNSENWTFKLYKSLNHLMISGEGKPSNIEYSNPGNVDDVVIKDIARWINSMN